LLAFVPVILNIAVMAQAADDPQKAALRRMQQSTQRLQTEKAALEREKGELSTRLETAAKERDGLKGEAARARRRVEVLEKELAQLRVEHGDLKVLQESTQKNLAQTDEICKANAAQAEAEQKRTITITTNLKSVLAREEAGRKTCQANNLKLRTLAFELLDRYQKKGLFDRALQAEPFVQFKTVEIENLVQDYRDKIDVLEVGQQQ